MEYVTLQNGVAMPMLGYGTIRQATTRKHIHKKLRIESWT